MSGFFSIIPITFNILPIIFVIWFAMTLIKLQRESNMLLKEIAEKLNNVDRKSNNL
ncbi:hypothetical protein ACVWXS_000479 [Lysinibacillus sp. TE18511]